jgi:holo-[acyl-carrier protein] synthase
MKALVGIDIQPIDEVRHSLEIFGDRYRRRLFTEHELASCGDNRATASRLAERFAAKEAVLKILDTTEMVPPWRSIEVRSALGGGPEIALHDTAANLARRQGIDSFSVSISHDNRIAAATVVATVASGKRRTGS